MLGLQDITIKDIISERKKRFLHYTPSLKQKMFHDIGAQAFERLLSAGNRFGKTFAALEETIAHATGIYPRWWEGRKFKKATHGCISGPSFQTLKEVIQPLLLGECLSGNGLLADDLILDKPGGPQGVVRHIAVRHISGGISMIYFRTYEQGREKYQAAKYHYFHFDEEPPLDIYREGLMRLMDTTGEGTGIAYVSATPLKGVTPFVVHFIKRTHKILDEFGEEKEELWEVPSGEIINKRWYMYASWNDTTHLTEETKELLTNTLPPYELSARMSGIPCLGKGMIYQYPEEWYTVEDFEIPKHWAKVIGLDIGFVAPTAAVWIAWDRDKDIWYLYKEYYVSMRSASQNAACLLTMGADKSYIICDPAISSSAQTDGDKVYNHYLTAGITTLVKAKYAKEHAIDIILERLRNKKFMIFKSCIKTLEEMRQYHRKEDGKPAKGNDHAMNALEFVATNGIPYFKTENEFYSPEYNLNSNYRMPIKANARWF